MPAVLEKPAPKQLARGVEPGMLLRDPLRIFDWMRDEMDRLFETLPIGRRIPATRFATPWIPALEVYERDGNLHIKTDLPGMKKEEVVVEVTAEGIIIKGERKSELTEEKEEEGYFRTERAYGEFYRFVPLPEGALLDKIDAMFKDGVLELTVPVPKLEKVAPRKVAVK